MKKKILFVLASVLVFSFVLAGCNSEKQNGVDSEINKEVNKEVEPADDQEESKDTIIAKGKFVLGLDDSFPPMGFRDEAGNIVGFDIDLANEVAKRMNLEIELKPIDWDSKILVLDKGDIDVIWNAFTASDERRKQVNFTDTYLKNKQIIVVAGDSKIEDKSGLKDKVLGLQSGSTSQDALDKDVDVLSSLKDVKKYSDNVKALLDLKIGRVDAVLVDEVVGRYYVSKKPGDYKILEEHFGEEEYAVGVRKGENEFLEKLNQTLKEIREDGTEAEISKKWFGEDITGK